MAVARFFSSLLSHPRTVEMILISEQYVEASISVRNLLLQQIHPFVGLCAPKPLSHGTHVHFGEQ